MKEVIRAKNAPCPTTGPYSQAIKAGKTLYIAGTCGEKPFSWELAGGGNDIKAETVQVMENLKAIVEEAGGSLVGYGPWDHKSWTRLKDITDERMF